MLKPAFVQSVLCLSMLFGGDLCFAKLVESSPSARTDSKPVETAFSSTCSIKCSRWNRMTDEWLACMRACVNNLPGPVFRFTDHLECKKDVRSEPCFQAVIGEVRLREAQLRPSNSPGVVTDDGPGGTK